jgi:transposase-like protein
MSSINCSQCGSRYFRQLDRVDIEGHRAKLNENEPVVFQCSNCNHTFTVQDGQTVPFVESRKPMPAAMTEAASQKPVDEGGPIG